VRRAASFLVALAVAACSEEPSREGVSTSPTAMGGPSRKPPSVLEPGAFPPRRAPREVAGPRGSARPRFAPPQATVAVVPVAVREGEDGHGNTVSAVRPAAIDLVVEGGWHAGGLATTLRVGDLHFHDMGYPTVTTMRFIVADVAVLPRDAEVALEVGGPSGQRRVLALSLPVAR
jgi:hypothetical protein